ncbi:hypothetical protein LCGC14_2112110 [marine sediment metagenome]|uniref:Uncharacterized protein n=1 Tax=marine sediment metagenome TaxID=412755 RepID=A0A0F9H316_9ZZZZ
MQITVKSVKVLKTGNNNYGEWKLVKVYTDKGEYTTLYTDADQIPGGSVINITDMDEDDKGKRFKKFEIIAAGATPPSTPPSSDMSKDEWAEKDMVKRASIEGQNALTNLTNLTIAKIKLEDCPVLLREALQCKIEGYMGATSTTTPPKTEVKVKTQEKKEELPESSIDMDSLAKDLKTLEDKKIPGWSKANTLGYMKTTYKVEAETVLEAVDKLDKGQYAHFVKAVETALKMI